MNFWGGFLAFYIQTIRLPELWHWELLVLWRESYRRDRMCTTLLGEGWTAMTMLRLMLLSVLLLGLLLIPSKFYYFYKCILPPTNLRATFVQQVESNPHLSRLSRPTALWSLSLIYGIPLPCFPVTYPTTGLWVMFFFSAFAVAMSNKLSEMVECESTAADRRVKLVRALRTVHGGGKCHHHHHWEHPWSSVKVLGSNPGHVPI